MAVITLPVASAPAESAGADATEGEATNAPPRAGRLTPAEGPDRRDQPRSSPEAPTRPADSLDPSDADRAFRDEQDRYGDDLLAAWHDSAAPADHGRGGGLTPGAGGGSEAGAPGGGPAAPAAGNPGAGAGAGPAASAPNAPNLTTLQMMAAQAGQPTAAAVVLAPPPASQGRAESVAASEIPAVRAATPVAIPTTPTASSTKATVSDPVDPSITAPVPTTIEGASAPGVFRVWRTGDLSTDLTVYYEVGGTATAGEDYALLPGSVVLPAGADSADIPVTAYNDMVDEGQETVVVTLRPDPGYTLSEPISATVTIYDASNPPPPPVADDDSYTISHSQTLFVDARGLLANDYDPGGDPLIASVVTTPAHGTLVQFGEDGSFSYVPEGDYVSPDSFTYKVNDGLADSNIATVTLMVTNQSPTANDDMYGVYSGSPVTVAVAGVLANDTDADEDWLTANLVGSPANGSLTLNPDGSFTYTPNAGFSGTDTFTYTATDGLADSNLATVTLNVHAVNSPPVAANDAFSVAHNDTLTVVASGLLANDSDPDNDPLTASLASGPAHGTLSLNSDGSFTYTPDLNFTGTDSFTYLANDGADESGVATVSITVTNDSPSAGDDYYTALHDRTLTVDVSGLLTNDTDPDGDPLTARLASDVSHGALALNSDGSFVYAPARGFVGTDRFTYKANDGIDDSNVALVILDVTNATPIGTKDYYNTPSGQPLVATTPGVLANDYDPDGDPLTASLVNGPANGTLSFNADGSFNYTPNAGFIGNDTFTYRPTDGVTPGGDTTATITVRGNTPVANDDEFAVGADQVLTVSPSGVLSNDASPDGNPLSAILESGPSYGSLTLNPDGSLVYIPNAGFSGDDSFTYNTSDNGLLALVPAQVIIHVVKIELQTAGVGAGQKLNPGGFVMINANNDNGSRITNEIPARRDFDVNRMQVNDPDLVQVNVAINPANVQLPGFFQLTVTNNGTGRIRLWDNRTKARRVEGVYTSATLPNQFFIEGAGLSAVQRDSQITLQYIWVNNLTGLPNAVARDDVNMTVTPAVNLLDITTQGAAGVVFRNGRNGLQGMISVGQNFNTGAVFDAQVMRRGAAGNLIFIQNAGVPRAFAGLVNGFNGGPANGWTFTQASRRPAMNNVFIDPTNRRQVGEVLDKAGAQLPPPPDYLGLFRQVPTGNPDLAPITAQDGPTTVVLPGALALDLTNIAVEYHFRMYLVWRFGAGANAVIYTLATRDWNVIFRADTFAVGQGPTRVANGSGVFSPNNVDRNNHANPIVVRPTFNESIQTR
ncbi:MAG TPA: Ig-like domain-containing protein [Gemmataceae bacterium]|nr:Ig-like domain-containing protein [Gemmataceae bacterium]